ncbi:hypothetical protein L7F22_057599 [Adiantum nelumboides]|nr:hypothetical protein [Adiantum nelumboides]
MYRSWEQMVAAGFDESRLQPIQLTNKFSDHFFIYLCTGTIPGSLGGFPSMSVLDLSHNWLSGEVPLELGSLFQLEYLNLSRNKLAGRLPSTLADCAQLISLNLSTNHLSGPLLSLPNMMDLNVLDLSYNNFTGPIPNALPFNNTSSTTTILLNGNPGLCGTLVQRECTSAPSSMLGAHDKHAHVGSAIQFVGIVLGTILLALLLATFGFILWKKKKKKKRQQRGYKFETLKHPAGVHLIHTSIVSS